VTANGRALGALQTAQLPANITVQVGLACTWAATAAAAALCPIRRPGCHGTRLCKYLPACIVAARASRPTLLPQATPVRDGKPTGIIISTPFLRIRVAQRAPKKPAQVRGPQRARAS
jgi:hypothetical protein